MAHPKRRHSRSRRDKRRGQWTLNPLALSRCSQCGAFKKTHRVCPECGHYRGEQRVDVTPAEGKKER